ncbi:MAG: sigma-70 family RNA polymerase sigma factor [Lentisphaeria bacterium]|nr:sigma-70 family RNA polymerase sigma factor [Lentisphaeria bacterium]
MTDKHLIKNYLAGDDRAFEQLYSRYRKQVYSYLNKMLPGQSAVVDDIYQKTWIKVVDNLRKYKDENRFIAYILRIARNQAIDHLRRSKWEVPVEPEQVDREESGERPSAELENREVMELIEQAVARLPDDQRDVFLMRRQAIPFKEIARIQQVTINTVLGRMRYAMDNLRGQLKRLGVEP